MKATQPLLALTALIFASAACSREAPPGADGPSRSEAVPTAAGNPTLPPELSKRPAASGTAASPAPASDGGTPQASAAAAHSGPWLVVTSPAAAVYSVRDFAKDRKIGYVKNGGRAAVRPTPEASKNCTGDWYEVVGGGYICANLGTTDLNHPQVKFAVREPNLDDVLPYVYARNAKNGTPLYKSVPSREQMDFYEPYLNAPKSEPAQASRDSATSSLAEPPALVRVEPQLALDAGVAMANAPDAGDPEADKKWWERDKDRLHEVKLDHLTEDADDILAKRMVTGFYVAVDKTFNWNGRTWYKTTKGLVAPADRFWQTAGSKFKGVELGAAGLKLPVGWTYGGRKTAPLYEIEVESKKVKPAGTVDVPTALQLTGREIDIKGTRYSETKDQKWIKLIHVRLTKPGPAPADLGPNERWIDVNLRQQTLVAFQGTTPVYATLVSTGKQSQDKDKDHRTPSGQWRIREKHITTTMDGDGSAAGDLPYSIEDVPYAMYFDGSYAVHGAFWHRNFGVQMSHGCVNLAPLDAKHLFFFADPQLPTGWHGIWSSTTRPGSRVVIHD